MQPIVPLIRFGNAGPQVANLIQALLLLIDRGVIKALDDPSRPTAVELRELGERARAELAGAVFGEATRQLIVYFQVQQGLGDTLQGVVEIQTAARLNEILKPLGVFDVGPNRVVRGTVRHPNGDALSSVVIRVLDRDLRREELLGQTRTDDQGRYEVRYVARQSERAEKDGADLQVRAFETEALDRLLAESPVHFNAGREAVIDLTVEDRKKVRSSEFETYLATLQPLLQGQDDGGADLAVANLKETDVDFLAKETGIDAQHLGWLASAHRTGAGLAFELAQPACYGWFRKGIAASADAIRQQSPSELRRRLLEAIDEHLVPASLARSVDAIVESIGHPEWQAVKQLLVHVQLPVEKAREVSAGLDTIDALDDIALRGLTQSGVLDEAQADRLGLAVSLYRAIDASASAVEVVLKRVFASLGHRRLHKTEDLARLDRSDWAALLTDAGVAPPDGSTIEAIAIRQEEIAVGAYPTVGLLHRVMRAPSELSAHVQALQPRSAVLEKLWETPLVSAEADALAAQLPSQQQAAFTAARHTALRYPGLNLDDLKLPALVEAVEGVTNALSRVASRNSHVDLLSLDLSSDSGDVAAIEPDGLDEPQRKTLVRQLRAMQRVLAVAEHPTVAQQLMGAGYHTATRIALATRKELVEGAGLTEAEADHVYARARTASLQAVHAWMAVRDAQSDAQLIRGVGTAMSVRSGRARQLARWAELFGGADACDCDHCQSVLSPAAYFVDLMHYVERFILEPSKSTTSLDSQLATRRSDLWEDSLISCKSTNEVVPTLDIVNRLLEKWITVKRPQWQTALQVYGGLAASDAANPSCGLPVNFPLERLEILLAHFGLSRDRIARALKGSSSARVNSRLKTWPAERDLIETARPDDGTAARYFEALFQPGNINLPNGPGRLDQITDKVNLSWLQASTRVDRDVLRALLRSRFVSTDGSTGLQAVEIKSVAGATDVQNTSELVSNLTRRRLDRLHRLIRLWRKVPWTVAELDYVLTRITAQGAVADLTATTLEAIIDLLDLSDSTGLPLEEVMALWDDIPREGFRGQASLFDRRFNAEPFLVRGGSWPTVLPLDLPLPVTAAAHASDSTGARLLAALKMNDAAFSGLIESLEVVAGLVTTTGGARSLRVSMMTLPILYRHAALCKVLKVKPGELMRLIRLTPEIAARAASNQIITNRADVLSLQRFAIWQRASGYSSEELAWLIDPTKRPASEPDPATVAGRMIERVGKDRLVAFPATLFTGAGFTEAQSRQVMASLEGAAVERTLAIASRQTPTGPSAPSTEVVPQEGEYRVRKSISDSALNGFVAAAVAPWAFDVAETAVFGLARRLGEFDDTAFTKLFLKEALSKDLVRRNLDDGLPTSKRRPFVSLSGTGGTLYGLNPDYFSATRREPLVVPTDQVGNPINLAGTIVLGFLRNKVQVSVSTPPASTARAVVDTLFTELSLSEQQSQWLVALNPVVATDPSDASKVERAFLPDPSGRGVVLNEKVVGTTSRLPDLSDPLSEVRRRVSALLRSFDPLVVVDRVLAAELGLDADVVKALHDYPGGVQTVDASEVFGDKVDLATLRTFVGQMQRLKRLFPAAHFDVDAVRFVLEEWSSAFAGDAGATIDLTRLRAIAAYRRWLSARPDTSGDSIAVEQEARRTALETLASSVAGQLTDAQRNALVAAVLGASEAEIRGLREVPHLWLGTWHEQLDQAHAALEIARRLGVSGRTLTRIGGFDATANTVDEAWKAADDIYGAFRAKYPDEKTYREKSEAFEDLIRSKRRDALVAFVLANPGGLALRTPSDLYAHFLIDVEAGGCARTSRLVAAISSLQLYVHRVLIGLELAQFGESFEAQEARAQWYWRKNYRVWEANRKVFLFPENFIEPDLRDDKTPLFRDLEDELLQRRISTSEAEEGYAKYLTGYSEVAGLKIVGAFHDVVRGRELGFNSDDIYVDTLHLVGATADDPPVHYLRRLYNLTRSKTDPAKYPIQFSAWEKLSTQIPVKWVSPVVYQRKLMLFWVEIATVSTTRRVNGQSHFDGYEHKFKVKYSERRADGTSSAPQELSFFDGVNPKRRSADPLRFVRGPESDPNFPSSLPTIVEANSNQTLLGANLYHYLLSLLSKESAGDVTFIEKFKAVPSHGRTVNYAASKHHAAPDDSFTVVGWQWDRAYPTVRVEDRTGETLETLQVAAMNSEVHGFVDLPNRDVPFVSYSSLVSNGSTTRCVYANGFLAVDAKKLLVSWRRSSRVGHHIVSAMDELFPTPTQGLISAAEIATFASADETFVVNQRGRAYLDSEIGNGTPFVPSAIASVATLGGTPAAGLIQFAGSHHVYVHLSTSLWKPITKRFYSYGVEGLLDLRFQEQHLREEPLGLSSTGNSLALPQNFVDPSYVGPFGTYLRELFFHIPFLIANHLNSQQRFEEAQRWYHYIFNPMTVEPNGVWRCREFANLSVESLRKALTDAAALAAYRNDPVNPHAIARLRLSAYQKSIVMKYIDNILDWGDKLFSQFTMESVNEATMLYVLAADILGERPNKLPKCMQERDRSYNDIKPHLSDVSDFLIEEMEQVTIKIPGGQGSVLRVGTGSSTFGTVRMASTATVESAPGLGEGGFSSVMPGSGAGFNTTGGYWSQAGGTSLANLYGGGFRQIATGTTAIGGESGRLVTVAPIDFVEGSREFGEKSFGNEIDLGVPGLGQGVVMPNTLDIKYTLHDVPPPHRFFGERFPPKEFNQAELVPARSIFCFPVNRELLAYHDRVQDRLYKIRHCMDIAGVRRRLALFAPEIDPRLLVRMKAAGLSLEDVLDSTSGHAPPYRFGVLLEKARQYATTVQGLGAQLLSALEKRDNEELTALRTVHEQHLLEMRTQLMRWEIQAANDSLAGLQKQREAAEYRQQHFEQLTATGLVPWEQMQQASIHTALGLSAAAVILDIAAGIAGGAPDVYAPMLPAGTTAKTGGSSIGTVLARIASAVHGSAGIAQALGSSAGLEATFQRRDEEWTHQAELAKREVAQLDKQIEAGEIRVSIAERSLDVHQKSIEQAREVFEFHRGKFTSLGLFTWMSTQLHRYHRLAFDAAWNMARMAERALHFERPELREAVSLGAPSWSADRAGLLSGESLLLDLQRLEASYLLTNTRQLEVEQSFSLAQYYPDKLVELRERGECSFDVPELFFDLYYPGHYFRRVKAVRLSVPCIVGPHTSIGATLRMAGSRLRDVPDANGPLAEVPLRHAPTLAASTAQNDAGVFEFSFRDDRLLPFEGMGAISSWDLRLPQQVRPFDYRTISDVILRISYTAREDDLLRDAVDSNVGAIVARLRDAAPNVALSLRHDFPEVWAKLKQAPATDGKLAADFVDDLKLTEASYPWWLRGRLNSEEDATLHALFKDKGSKISAKVGDAGRAALEEPPPTANQDGTWWSGSFLAAKPEVSPDPLNPGRLLRITLDRNDMTDIVVVLGAAT